MPKNSDCGPLRTSIWAVSKNPACTRRMVETCTPSKSKATAESNAAEMLDEPTPRKLSWPPEPEPPTCTLSVGTRLTTSATWSTEKSSSVSPPMAVTVTGTSCRLSAWRRAWTTITRSPNSLSLASSSSLSCAKAVCGNAATARIAALPSSVRRRPLEAIRVLSDVMSALSLAGQSVLFRAACPRNHASGPVPQSLCHAFESLDAAISSKSECMEGRFSPHLAKALG